jgi:hypothetical protein
VLNWKSNLCRKTNETPGRRVWQVPSSAEQKLCLDIPPQRFKSLAQAQKLLFPVDGIRNGETDIEKLATTDWAGLI